MRKNNIAFIGVVSLIFTEHLYVVTTILSKVLRAIKPRQGYTTFMIDNNYDVSREKKKNILILNEFDFPELNSIFEQTFVWKKILFYTLSCHFRCSFGLKVCKMQFQGVFLSGALLGTDIKNIFYLTHL